MPDGTFAVISDTVGFIRDLPKDLVDTFRATLDELLDSSVLLHVVDITEKNFLDRISSVETVLDDIGAGDIPRCLVMNKIDASPSEQLAGAVMKLGGIPVSAKEKKGFDEILKEVRKKIQTSKLK